MAEQIILSNDILKVVISTHGAEMQSILKNNKEKLWNGDPLVWSGRAPLMFPICGGLRDDKFIFEGKEYILEKHGYARKSEFIIEKAEKTQAVFLLCSDEKSRKVYPFDYELRVKYSLFDNEIYIEYEVTNKDNKNMYFSIGSHEAYLCQNGIEDCSVIFECEEDMTSTVLEGNLLEYKTDTILKKAKELPLKYEYFSIDALVFLNLKSRKAILKNKKTNECITVSFNDSDYFLLWTKPDAKYICLEPWCGIQDFVDSNYDITKKRGIIKASPDETVIRSHSIVF